MTLHSSGPHVHGKRCCLCGMLSKYPIEEDEPELWVCGSCRDFMGSTIFSLLVRGVLTVDHLREAQEARNTGRLE